MFKKLSKNKGKLIIFGVSTIATYFLFHAARSAAIMERGNSSSIGGECLLLLLPIIVVLIYDNISLTVQTFRKRNKKANNDASIHIISIDSIEVIDKQRKKGKEH